MAKLIDFLTLGAKPLIQKTWRAATYSPMQKLEHNMGKQLESGATSFFGAAMKKGPSAEAINKMGSAFEGATVKMSEKMADRMVSRMFPKWHQRHPVLAILGGTGAVAGGYTMLAGRGEGGGAGYHPGPEEMGRMAAEQEFATELQMASAMQPPMGAPMMGGAPANYMPAAQPSIRLPQSARIDAQTANYQGRLMPEMMMGQSV